VQLLDVADGAIDQMEALAKAASVPLDSDNDEEDEAGAAVGDRLRDCCSSLSTADVVLLGESDKVAYCCVLLCISPTASCTLPRS
jgi:hypothetical protein